MARRIFISFDYDDQAQAKGFNLLRWNDNVSLEFVGRHLLDPVNSTNQGYIESKVNEQIDGTSATVVLLGKNTHNSEWVAKEIRKSLAKDNPNGVLAIKLKGNDGEVPADSPVGQALKDAGAEIIGWDVHQFQAAIERAVAMAGRTKSIQRSMNSGGDNCVR